MPLETFVTHEVLLLRRTRKPAFHRVFVEADAAIPRAASAEKIVLSGRPAIAPYKALAAHATLVEELDRCDAERHHGTRHPVDTHVLGRARIVPQAKRHDVVLASRQRVLLHLVGLLSEVSLGDLPLLAFALGLALLRRSLLSEWHRALERRKAKRHTDADAHREICSQPGLVELLEIRSVEQEHLDASAVDCVALAKDTVDTLVILARLLQQAEHDVKAAKVAQCRRCRLLSLPKLLVGNLGAQQVATDVQKMLMRVSQPELLLIRHLTLHYYDGVRDLLARKIA
eukprot:scaffold33275_cov76-Phaeocystis_antarctica.AAC.2